MKAAILGHHPDLYPGFNSVMTANFAYGLATAGVQVTVLLPETAAMPQAAKLEAAGLTERTLDTFGAEVAFRVIQPDSALETVDLTVWQSYFAQDEAFWPAVRAASRAVTKNFPRLFTGLPERDEKALLGAASRFDLIGLALRGDVEIVRQQFMETRPDEVGRCLHTPRGFRADWFTDAADSPAPVLGIEKGVNANGSEYAHLVPAVSRLRDIFPELQVIGARIRDPDIIDQTLPLLHPREFYRQFLSPLWAYLMIDINHSHQSSNVLQVDGKRVYPGIYENQVVEAQMAGAVVVGQDEALPSELLASPLTGLRIPDLADTDAIVAFLAAAFRDRERRRSVAREWAVANHSVRNMVSPILDALGMLPASWARLSRFYR